jgi:hypothetical protein
MVSGFRPFHPAFKSLQLGLVGAQWFKGWHSAAPAVWARKTSATDRATLIVDSGRPRVPGPIELLNGVLPPSDDADGQQQAGFSPRKAGGGSVTPPRHVSLPKKGDSHDDQFHDYTGVT